ncbi:PREDICTED: mavicyanin-like [Fragaria vesca subsp. vesca]|uniref:mavicyanin-like n=1 Tax=Fragaria vesca subsp. vesca TaxID=101020 RepID=UPI0002C2FB73|nr:PREDICTED: mavicyanin-like [Fragaria vesca subsp. vesca]
MESSKVFLLFFFLSVIQVVFVTSTEFQVGDKSNGWEVPKSKSDQDMYNEWASKNRFKVNDTLNFNFKKDADSVMVVTEAEYEKCHSDKPIFTAKDGGSVFKLDRPGLFYFISGTDGHCEKGQKMIVKVLASPAAAETESPPPSQSANQNATAETPASHDHANHVDKKNNAVAMHAAAAITLTTAVMSFLGALFF